MIKTVSHAITTMADSPSGHHRRGSKQGAYRDIVMMHSVIGAQLQLNCTAFQRRSELYTLVLGLAVSRLAVTSCGAVEVDDCSSHLTCRPSDC